MIRSRATLGGAALLALASFGCSEPNSPSDPLQPQMAVGHPETPSNELLELCKVGPNQAFDFTVTLNGANLPVGGTTTPVLTPDATLGYDCERVAVKGGAPTTVSVTEAAAAGFTLDSIVVDQLVVGGGSTTSTKLTGTNTGSGVIGGQTVQGAVITFYNSADTPDPGLEGCTPGYWKQSQHFGNWTSPYTTSTLFDDVFANAFPGMTLLEVLSLGGGGLNALGRHTVAALLNAASADVDGEFTVAQVIAAFDAAFASGNYETQKNIFAVSNELGCPL